MIWAGIRRLPASRQWTNQLQFYSTSLKQTMEFRNERVENDPRVIQDLEIVDFDSSFSDASQGSLVVAKNCSIIDNNNHTLSKGERPITHSAINKTSQTNRIPNYSQGNKLSGYLFSSQPTVSECSDFEFSDDDESVLRAAADHKAIKVCEKLKRTASSTLKVESKKAAPGKPANLLGFHSIDFERTEERFISETIPVKTGEHPVIEDINVGSTSASSNILMTSAVQIPSMTDSNFSKPLNPMRNFSTSTTRALGNTPAVKKEASYHSIQFATQKPEITENGFVPSADNIKNVKPIILSSEQEYVLKQVQSGHSIFYTGSAGTGKSVLLKTIIKSLKNQFKEGGVAVTASTGLAACNIGGITLHSFAGVGLAKEPVDQLLKKLRRNRKAVNKWLKTKVLIIDEVSMVDGELLNKFNEMAKRIRKNQLPFGGIQLVVCGDFYQLPPVVKRTDFEGNDQDQLEQFFAFECHAWKENIKQTIILREIFRQRGDQVFIDMLNEMRNGIVSEESIREFNRLSRPLNCPAGIVPTELFATRNEVDRANNFRLNKIRGEAQVYNSVDGGSIPNPQRQSLLSNFLAPSQLFLKKDAQVMCIKNFDETLVNGSLGQVIDFMDKDTYLKATTEANDNESDYIFANESSSTISSEIRSQNLSCTSEISSADSKKKLATGDTLVDDKKQIVEQNQKRKDEMADNLREDSKNKKYPLVKFLLPDGVNTRTVLVEPEQWTVEDDVQLVLASRVQLPLILAWSISIHKSQGQTLPKVKVDLKNVFETGQSYVALSRAVSRDGLQVLNFNETKVRSHPKVVEFYKTLLSAEDSRKVSKGQQKLNFTHKVMTT